jgi:hypothetical protein
MAGRCRRTDSHESDENLIRDNLQGLTWKIFADPLLPSLPPIHAATSSMLGTVADTVKKRTLALRRFILDTTTSIVAPRGSFKM